MTIYEVLCFLLGSTIVAICSSSDDINEVNSEYPSHNAVYWIVQTNPVIFGQNVTLFCITANVENVCMKCPTRWYGGTKLSLLSYNGYPSKNKKYVPSTGRDGFGIVITQFDREDLNVNYSCSFGPYFDKKNLTEDMLHVNEEPGEGDSPEKLNIRLIAGILLTVIGIVVVCSVMYRLVLKKNRQHTASREHKSDGNNFSKNISNSACSKCYSMTANNPTEKLCHKNSKDLQICSLHQLLPHGSV